jgi:mRNA-degrading endonuclease RelE of RelBE toxin-antitoxin system
MWRVVVPRSVVRALSRLPGKDRERIEGAIEAMIDDPFGGDFKKLHGKSYRLRVGSYRVLYEIDQKKHIVEVHDVVRRTSTTY